MGKYDKVVPDLPKLPPKDKVYQQRVDTVKAKIPNRDAVQLANSYDQLRIGTGPELGELEANGLVLRLGKNGIEALLSRCNLFLAAYEQLLVESQDTGAPGWGQYGVKSNALRLPSGTTIRVESEPYAQIRDKEAFRLWCKENGYERQMQLPWQTTNAIVKERLLAGVKNPDGCDAFQKPTVVFTAAGSTEDDE